MQCRTRLQTAPQGLEQAWDLVLGILALEELGPESPRLPLGLSFPDVKLVGWGWQAQTWAQQQAQSLFHWWVGTVAALWRGPSQTLQGGAGDLLLSVASCWDTELCLVDYSILSLELGPPPM